MKVNLFGAAGCSREVYAIAIRVGYDIAAFVDRERSKDIYGIPVLSEDEYDASLPAIIAIGNSDIREKIFKKIIAKNPATFFPVLIDPYARILNLNTISIGQGSIIFAGTVMTCDISIGEFAHLNLNTTIGHDSKIGDFFTTAPSVNIAGNSKIGKNVYFGSGSGCKEKLNICDYVKIGMGSTVVKDITESGTYIGIPANKLLKKG